MRKICLFITLCFALGVFAQRVSEAQALQKAQAFLQGKSFSKTNKARSVMGKSQTTPFDNFYIFNVENDEGYVIVSGDARTKEILGYSDRGHLNYDEMPCNLKSWLGYYEEAIKAIPADLKPSKAATRGAREAVSPLLMKNGREILWYQGPPFNDYCPASPEDPNEKSVTGCVATAMAQVMYFYEWPNKLPALDAYTYNDTVTVSALEAKTMNWNGEDELRWLSRYCGQSVQMIYGKDGSSATDGTASAAMVNHFQYDKAEHTVHRDAYDADTWDELMYKELIAGRPVIYAGHDVVSEPGVDYGHAFVIDGYDGNGYYHVNWGWGGGTDYYALDVMNAPNDHMYSSKQMAAIGIQPDNGGKADYPLFACTGMEVTSDLEVTRESADDTFKNVTISWKMATQLAETGTFNLCIYISDATGGDPLLTYSEGEMYVGHTYSHSMTFDGQDWVICPKGIDGKTDYLADGTYKLSMRYRAAGEEKWREPDGCDYRYITMTKSGNTLKFVNHPSTVGPDPTGISAPSIKMPAAGDDAYYDLTGRRVQSPTKGLYIKNGKKIVVK